MHYWESPMKPLNRALIVLGIATAVGWLFAAPASAAQRRGGGGGGGHATSSHAPSGGGGGGGPRGGSGGGSYGGGAPAPRAVPRDNGAGASTPAGSGSSASTRPTSNRGANSGTAVGRATQPGNGGGTPGVIQNGYYGGFYPWGYAGLGFGGYYGGYYGSYDPWLYDPYYDDGYYDAPYYAPEERADAELRLKVKPREAKVYVDGYFAGVVDDFDGVFQRLHLVPGQHHIEIRADGYAPLEFDIDARRNRTTTYEGELKQQ